MGILHVHHLPERLHSRIRKLAAAENVSLSAEVVSLLDSAVRDRECRGRQARLLSDIRRRRFRLPAGEPDSVTLIREDRNR